MSSFSLKRYQEAALSALEKYLRAARLQGARSAFEGETGYGYNAEPFGETPCVCLRIPTGGGKTLLAAHAVGRMAREWPHLGAVGSARPLALWLVPSDTIRTQTLNALSTPGHPFREALARACGDGVRVCDLETVGTLAQLARHQYPLAQRLATRIAELRDKAAKSAFTQLVLAGGWEVAASPSHEFKFGDVGYPVSGNKRYQGKFRFSQHFYPVLADLEDGSEEWRCAMALDDNAQVLHWVRNLDSDPVAGFWLPTSFGRFHPDFVCQLNDDRVFVAEYKGAHLRNVPKEIEKAQVGAVWAERSHGRAVFGMIFKQDRGMGMAQQIEAALA